MKEIPLTRGQVAIVDDEDYEYLNQFKWCAQYNTKTRTYYAIRTQCLGQGNGKAKRKTLRMHRVLMNPPKNKYIDHINHDTLDNRRLNLRIVTNRQNTQNQKTKTSSQYPGVSWNKNENKWRAYIRIKDKHKHLGYFVSEKDAFKAYKKALEELGETLLEKVGEI